jgi:hypothetical protein
MKSVIHLVARLLVGHPIAVFILCVEQRLQQIVRTAGRCAPRANDGIDDAIQPWYGAAQPDFARQREESGKKKLIFDIALNWYVMPLIALATLPACRDTSVPKSDFATTSSVSAII